MKSKKIFIGIIVVVAVILVAVLSVLQLLNKRDLGLKKSGSFYENISEFALSYSDEPDELTQSFLKAIRYEITHINNENMIATVDIYVPVISDELPAILDDVIAKNINKEYADLMQIAENELSSMLDSNQIETKKSTISLQLKKIDGSYKIILSDEWNEILTENLESFYISYLESLIGRMTDEIPK